MKPGTTLRQRIVLMLLPLCVLPALLGGAGLWLLQQLGGSIDVILRENYDSVVAMQELTEAVERIDSSFQFMLVAKGLTDANEREKLEASARATFAENWRRYQTAFDKERANVTIHPGEDRLNEQLNELTNKYRSQGDGFFQTAASGLVNHQDYYGTDGLHPTFAAIRKVADDILQLNQRQMKKASDSASRAANSSLVWLSLGFVCTVGLSALVAWQTIRTTLAPIHAVKEAAVGITSGNLDQLVPVFSRDELGQLAEAFNVMARHLRDYRQSQSAHLLRAQQTSQATIDSFPDAILVVDSDGCVEMANPAARRLLGVASRTADQPAKTRWQPPESLRRPLEDALVGQRDFLPEGFDQIVLLGEHGRELALLPRILTIRDPDARSLGAAVLLQDVTRLRLLDQVKSDLVATASHELKTPLTSVRLAIHLLLEETVGSLNPKQIELLLDARENSERLLAMVNNLLDLARLEQGSHQLQVEPASIASLVRDAVDAVAARAQDHSVTVNIDVPAGLPLVNVDAERIGHALRNLLDNALTYTDSGGTITVSAKKEQGTVTLSIRDSGSGIAAEYLPHLFEKFFRVPGQSRGTGAGLGLAIVHEIVTAHGGTIDCESEPAVGTTFRIRLPIAVSAPAPALVSGVGPSSFASSQET